VVPPDFATFTIPDIEQEFATIAREARDVLGALDERQINWKPGANRWSVAQCLDHLLTIDRLMFDGMDAAMDPARPKSLTERFPVLPSVFGRMMIRVVGPVATRKYSAPKSAVPSTSVLDPAIVARFIDHQAHNARRVRALDGRNPERVIMRSPFAPIPYTVLDACRIVAAHERRHFEQARRVTQEAAFPGA